MKRLAEKVMQIVGLSGEPTEEQLIEGLDKHLDGQRQAVANSAAVLKVVSEQLGIDAADSDVEKVSNAVRTAVEKAKNPAAGEAVEQLKSSTARLQAAEAKIGDMEWSAFVQANAKRIPPSKLVTYRKLWGQDRAGLTDLVSGLPELVSTASDAPLTGDDRQQVINSAAGEYKASPELQMVCNARAFVNDALRGKHLGELSEEEVKKL